jgi:hypothetical protein
MGFPQRVFPQPVAKGQGGNFCLRGNEAWRNDLGERNPEPLLRRSIYRPVEAVGKVRYEANNHYI